MMRYVYRRSTSILSTSLAVLILQACGQNHDPSTAVSKPLVTDVDHTDVKRQSIGNCWLYAQASWVESLHKSATDESIDVSETYWTYWHWYEQILSSANYGRKIEEISTGGSWRTAQNLLRRYGVIREGDFIPYEAGRQMSQAQAIAEIRINQSLSQGLLANLEDRTPANIQAALDQAFSVDMASKQAYVTPADQFEVAAGQKLDQIRMLSEIMGDWREYSLARYDQQSVFQFMKRALNDRQPVVMTMWVDFRYLNTESATFQETIYDPTYEGDGGHLVVLEDYVVNHPELGIIGEGDASDWIKQKAMEGDLMYVKAKNSWGTNRPDRGLTDGYTRFTVDYLLDASRQEVGYQYTSFVLPVGSY